MQITKFLNSPQGKSAGTLIAFAIEKTNTDKDNKILEDGTERIRATSEWLLNLPKDVSEKEALQAGVELLEPVIKESKRRWVRQAFKLLKALI